MITLFNIAKARGAVVDGYGVTAASEYSRVAVMMMGRCQRCRALLSPFDAYPGYNGMLYCGGCAEKDLVFETVEEFERWKPRFVSLMQDEGFRAMEFSNYKGNPDRIFVLDENGAQRELPTVYEVCSTCEGRGRVAAPAPELEDGSYDFSEAYRNGFVDPVCGKCNGLRVVLAVDEDRCDTKLLQLYVEQSGQGAGDVPAAQPFLFGGCGR